MQKFVDVREEGVFLIEFSDEECSSSEGIYSKASYEAQKESFDELLKELYKMSIDEKYREENASEFLRRHSTWLYNLAKTGFAIDYTQWHEGSLGIQPEQQ